MKSQQNNLSSADGKIGGFAHMRSFPIYCVEPQNAHFYESYHPTIESDCSKAVWAREGESALPYNTVLRSRDANLEVAPPQDEALGLEKSPRKTRSLSFSTISTKFWISYSAQEIGK